jgi:hypothetical protein
VCLLAGIVLGCTVSWAPPSIPIAHADTTALGVRAELPLIAMWPGETRRVAFPSVRCKAGCQFDLRGDKSLTFSLDEMADVFSPIIRGALVLDPRGQRVCLVRVDTLATPGDTLSAHYTVSTLTQPARVSRWHLRIVVEARAIAQARTAPIQFVTARPNPFHPGVTVSYTLAASGHVSLVVYDVRGQPVATLVHTVQGAGDYAASWNGRDANGKPAGSGVYFARLTSAVGTQSYKMTLLK